MTFTKFVPYDMKTFVISVTGREGKLIRGTARNTCLDGERSFDNQIQLIFMLDELFDSINFPQKSMESRCFTDKSGAGRELPATDAPAAEEKLLATFKVNVLFRQNASWQGNIVWLEKNLESQFRSVLELLLIMDSAFSE